MTIIYNDRWLMLGCVDTTTPNRSSALRRNCIATANGFGRRPRDNARRLIDVQLRISGERGDEAMNRRDQRFGSGQGGLGRLFLKGVSGVVGRSAGGSGVKLTHFSRDLLGAAKGCTAFVPALYRLYRILGNFFIFQRLAKSGDSGKSGPEFAGWWRGDGGWRICHLLSPVVTFCHVLSPLGNYFIFSTCCQSRGIAAPLRRQRAWLFGSVAATAALLW